MASQVSTTDIFKQLGARIADAHAASKDVAVAVGGGNALPGGINNGVAKLVTLEFVEGKKEDDKGKFYFRAAMVARTPDYHDGIKVSGKQDSKLIPFFDTPKREGIKTFLPSKKADGTYAGHYLTFRDLMAVSFGVKPPQDIQPGESKDAYGARINQYYAAAIQVLTDPSKPPVYFEYRTWQPPKATEGKYKDKESQVMVFWNARCDYVEKGAAANPAAGVSMAPPAMQPSNSNGAAPPAVMNPTPPFVEPLQLTPAPTAAQGSAFVATDAQLDEWAEVADADNDPPETDDGKDAVKKIAEVAKQHITEAEATASKNWTAVVTLVKQRRAGGTVAPAATGAKADPVKGDQRTYQAQVCEVTSVNPEAKTATLKVVGGKAVMVDGKLAKVPFAELS